MKRILSPLFVLTICMSLVGCYSGKDTSIPTTQIPTYETHTEPTETTQDTVPDNMKQLPMYAVSLPVTTHSDFAEDGTNLFYYEYPSISLIGPSPEIADAVILDFLNRIDKTVTEADQIKEYAQQMHESGDTWFPYFYEVNYRTTRFDQSVLSLYGKNIVYSGGVHPGTTYASLNYDLTNGQILRLTDILQSDTSSEFLCNEVISFISQNKDAEGLFEGYEYTVIERFNAPLDQDQCWHLSSNGLVFYFPPYEIGPYAAGAIHAVIPYNRLTGVLKDNYFPAEREDSCGEIFAVNFSETVANEYTQFSEVVLDADSNKIILFTNGSLHDVTLYTGSFNDIGTAFICDDEVYYASTLTPGDAIVIDANLNTDLPTLYLTYESGGKTSKRLISFDAESQTVVLQEP